MKTLMILRGLPGAGKSTLAAMLVETAEDAGLEAMVYAADDWMIDATGGYKFDRTKLGACHEQCKIATEWDLSNGVDLVIVHNTLTTEAEVEEYEILARRHGYAFVSLIVENRHGNSSIHAVPEETMKKMGARFSVSL